MIASGGRRWGKQVEALCMRRHLIELGVPSGAVWVELCSLTTAENAVYSAALLRSLSNGRKPRAAIATSGWHLPRALSNFERVGIDARGVAAIDPPPTLLQRVRRRAHEAVSGRLDAAALRRAGRLGDAFFAASSMLMHRDIDEGRR